MLAAIAVSVQALRITGKPTEYVAVGKVVVGMKTPGQAGSNEDNTLRNLFGDLFPTQLEIIESGELRYRALERVRALHPELKELDVEIRVSQTKGSMILNVVATGVEPKYTRVYLDALLDEYIEFRKEVVDKTIESKMKTVIEEVRAREKQPKQDKKELNTFERQNDPALLSAEHERLVEEVSTLRSEMEALKRSSNDSKAKSVGDTLKKEEKKLEEIWAKETKHQELKRRYEDSEKGYQEWRKSLPIVEEGCPAAAACVLERPTAAEPEEPQLWLPLIVWGVISAASGVLVMFIAAFALTRLSKNQEAPPPPLN